MKTKLTLTIDDSVIDSAKEIRPRKRRKLIGDRRKLFEIDKCWERTKFSYIR